MSVDSIDGRFIRNTDMIGCDPDQLSILLVCCINAQVSLPLTRLQQEPQVRELRTEWTGDISKLGIRCEERDEEEEHEKRGDCPGREDEIGDGHIWIRKPRINAECRDRAVEVERGWVIVKENLKIVYLQ